MSTEKETDRTQAPPGRSISPSIRPPERTLADDLRDEWPQLSSDERLEGFLRLHRADADDFFLSLAAIDQASVLSQMRGKERRIWLRLLDPDDAADVIQETAESERVALLELLDATTRKEVTALLAYKEDAAGGLMSPRFARLRPDMTVDEAIWYLRRQAQQAYLETIYYAYVLDHEQHLVGVASFRDLFSAAGDRPLTEVMHTEVISVPEDLDQEAVAQLVAEYDLNAIPVVDAEGHMKGIVTVDDVVDVVHEEATEDIQKLGGMAALETPYMQASLFTLVKKRAGWLAVLFMGELLTASAMSRYEFAIAHAVVLALFVPLIISSGGNSGSQASTLIIRAMALGEVTLRDWWRVGRREIAAGLALGSILAVLGFLRVVTWEMLFHEYGEHYLRIGLTVAISLVGVVIWGTTAGSMLPFIIRRFGWDPASASAPLVATLVDVSGLLIYFNVAYLLLRGALL